MNSNIFGENMINYYESSDHYEINELYNKNKLKVKTVVLTDGEVNKNTTIIDYSNGVELNGNKYAVDRVEKSVIECDKANFVIILKLVSRDYSTFMEKKNARNASNQATANKSKKLYAPEDYDFLLDFNQRSCILRLAVFMVALHSLSFNIL